MTRPRTAAVRGASAVLFLFLACATGSGQRGGAPPEKSVVIVVWDGLRPDAIDAADTPNLVRLRDAGTEFTDNHSTYPTFTMMNSASFATGGVPATAGDDRDVAVEPR